jgi:hypothetical protein
MKLYAATDEYQSIWPATIRDNVDDCIKAAIAASTIKCETEADLDKYGVCIAEFDDPSQLMPQPLTVQQGYGATRTYVKGFRTGQIVPSQASKTKVA